MSPDAEETHTRGECHGSMTTVDNERKYNPFLV